MVADDGRVSIMYSLSQSSAKALKMRSKAPFRTIGEAACVYSSNRESEQEGLQLAGAS